METFNIDNLVSFSMVVRKSKKGNEYKAIVLNFLDKDGNIVLEKQLDFLTNTQYETILSLLKK